MAPSPNRQMNQRDMRPSAPSNPYRRFNQPGAQTNQNGQISPSVDYPGAGPSMQPGMAQPMPSMASNAYSPSEAPSVESAPPPSAQSLGGVANQAGVGGLMSPNRYGTAQASSAPPPSMGEAEPAQSSMSAPGLPQAARQQTSGPQPQPAPYARQNMPQQAQVNRKIAPNVS